MAYIEIRDITKSYEEPDGGKIQVLSGISFDIKKGEFVSIFGPNGCGKSTLLNIIADLLDYESGSVSIDGKQAAESRIGYVFQKYSESLFPWLKNIDNIAFSLDGSKKTKKQKHELIENFTKQMGLDNLPLEEYPYKCSAGQQQLVALVRELIYNPDVLLMDEPFVSLDYDRRISQQESLLQSWHKTKTTILFVSHEIDEAIYLADRLVLLSQRPAEIVDVFEIPLLRPRSVEMFQQEEFFNIKIPILRKFMEIIGK